MLPVNQNHSDTSLNGLVHIGHCGQCSFEPESYGAQLHWLETSLRYVSDAVILINASGQIILLNPAAEKMTGWSLHEAKCLPIYEVILLTGESPQYAALSAVEILENGWFDSHRISQGLLKIRNSSCPSPVECTTCPIYDQAGQIIATTLVLREGQKSGVSIHNSAWQINHDFLTGLMNRRHFEHCLMQSISDACDLGVSHTLCYIDFDHFKVLNETLDYTAGDEFLRQVSLILQQCVRRTDILARLGGDEFGLVLRQCGLEQAVSVLETLCAQIHAFKFIWQGRTFNFSVSVGISPLTSQSASPSQLLVATKSACEIAKSKGRNRIHLYQSNDREISANQESIKWIPRLYKALEENRFCLYAQPIIEVNSECGGQPRSKTFEILLRLKDEAGQVIAPGFFIPVAERYGLMHLLDRWVIRNIFQYLETRSNEALQAGKRIDQDCLYMINLSGASLNDDQFLTFVEAQFAIRSVPPQMICFEITETMAIANLAKSIQLIQRLKALGCRFALDDFGSGMSSLRYLKNLPINYLKIDGGFIKDIVQNQVDCEIVEAIHRMSRAMGIQTIAEFVEDSAILDKLKTLGVNYAQGYGIAKPAPLAQAQESFEQW